MSYVAVLCVSCFHVNLPQKYALRELPTSFRPEPKQGVTLCCLRDDEARAYASGDEDFDALWRLNQICTKIPVHVIWGEVDDLL
jgi:hypothetical protein